MSFTRQQAAALGRGLAAQVERANGHVTVEQLRADHEQKEARLQARIDILQRRVHELEAQLVGTVPSSDGQNRDGREICTPAVAARRLGISQSTMSRYIRDGYVESYTISGGRKPRYMVFVDSLRRKPRRKG